MGKPRVVIIANKWWEADPLMNVLLSDVARDPETLGWPAPLHFPRRRPLKDEQRPEEDTSPLPRAVFHLKNLDAEVWCISDLLVHLPDDASVQSSSEVKMRYLPRIFAERPVPDLVVAFGTAGYPDNTTENGSVVVGTGVFMHDGHPAASNPASNWSAGPFDRVIDSSLDAARFNALTLVETSPHPSVVARFLVEPLDPAPATLLLARSDYVAVGEVNVTDPAEYAKMDAASLSAFSAAHNISLARSLETTHGLIRVQSEAPFVFVSGITDRVGHFADEVQPRTYAQNYVAAHNAGIVVAWMLVRANALFACSKDSSPEKR